MEVVKCDSVRQMKTRMGNQNIKLGTPHFLIFLNNETERRSLSHEIAAALFLGATDFEMRYEPIVGLFLQISGGRV